MNPFEKRPEGIFPTGKKRKNLIAANKEAVAKFSEDGRYRIVENYHYTWIDSPLEGDYSSFQHTFETVLPPGEQSLRQYIEKTLAPRKGDAIGIEFGGIGSRAFQGFSRGFFKKSVGVTLVDHRLPDTGRDQEDRRRNHLVMVGDILTPETYDSLRNLLNGEKVDLIVERMAKGLEFIPGEPYTAAKILKTWYALLREGGIMFVQVPIILNPILKPWIMKIRTNYAQTLEISFTKGSENSNSPSSALRIHKLPGAPEELPVLEPRMVRRLSTKKSEL